MAPPNSSYLTQLQDLSLSPFFSKQANKQENRVKKKERKSNAHKHTDTLNKDQESTKLAETIIHKKKDSKTNKTALQSHHPRQIYTNTSECVLY